MGTHIKIPEYLSKRCGLMLSAICLLVLLTSVSASLQNAVYQFDAVVHLETKCPGIVDDLASSMHPSSPDALTKVAGIEKAYNGLGSEIVGRSNIEGIDVVINKLYSKLDPELKNFAKGHVFEIKGTYYLEEKGETILFMEQPFDTPDGKRIMDTVTRNPSVGDTIWELKDWEELRLGSKTGEQLKRMEYIVKEAGKANRAAVLVHGGRVNEKYLREAGSRNIFVYADDKDMTLLNEAYLP